MCVCVCVRLGGWVVGNGHSHEMCRVEKKKILRRMLPQQKKNLLRIVTVKNDSSGLRIFLL